MIWILATASDILALQRMHDLAVYRERLEELSAKLAQRIEAIGADERVLILSDNDEDGVASAAIMHGMIAKLNPVAEERIVHLNESFRSVVVLKLIEQTPDSVLLGSISLPSTAPFPLMNRDGPILSRRHSGVR